MSQAEELQRAINAYCLECSCGSRNEVASCIITKCPLYRYRPFTDRKPGTRSGCRQIRLDDLLKEDV